MAGCKDHEPDRSGRWSLFLRRFSSAAASPHIPASDAQVLTELPAGARHAATSARVTGDLRYLGYAGAVRKQSLRGLTGHLKNAYAAIAALSPQEPPPEARVWRYSELGKMSEHLGNDEAAEHWFHEIHFVSG